MKKSESNAIIERILAKMKLLRIIPSGSDDPLPPVPETVEVDEDDLNTMSAAWDETMPDYKGLLDAEVINRRNAG